MCPADFRDSGLESKHYDDKRSYSACNCCVCADTMASFQHGLFGCFGNGSVCITTFFCPCYTAGKVAEMTGRSCFWHGLLYVLCTEISILCQGCIRSEIRRSKNIDGSDIGDCCILCFCTECALCQEARETGALGSTDMAGDCQVIERAWNNGSKHPSPSTTIIVADEFLLHCHGCNLPRNAVFAYTVHVFHFSRCVVAIAVFSVFT